MELYFHIFAEVRNFYGNDARKPVWYPQQVRFVSPNHNGCECSKYTICI